MLRKKYNRVTSHLRRTNLLSGVRANLEWDEQVMMPSSGSFVRGQQSSLIEGYLHDLKTDPEIGKLIHEVYNDNDFEKEFDRVEKSVIKLAKREYDQTVNVPKELAEETATLTSRSLKLWEEAKAKDDFSIMSPIFKRWIEIRKEMAQKMDNSKSPFDVWIDYFERGMNSKQIEHVFDRIKKRLIPLISAIQNKVNENESLQNRGDFLVSNNQEFNIDKQHQLSKQIVQEIGYNLKDSGRLDVSVHPFTTNLGSPKDVRITSKFRSDEFVQGIMGSVHEAGHAMYEQGLPKDYWDLPAGQSVSLGIHESQSLFWERYIALNRPFWSYLWPKVTESFPHLLSSSSSFSSLSNENNTDDIIDIVYRAVNKVKPILIRIESDEVTYPMHVIVRYEIEKELFQGDLSVDDIPQIFADKMEKYLGIRPKTLSEGALQDVHWICGDFGYFPTYLLGSIYAFQFYRTLRNQIENIDEKIASGEFQEIREWLRENIHQQGSLLTPPELVKHVTGEDLDPDAFVDYLVEKYSPIYGLDKNELLSS